MATKPRKRWTSNDDSSSDTDGEDPKTLKNISFTKREREMKMKKTAKHLNRVCDNDSDSGIKSSLSFAKKPIAIVKKKEKRKRSDSEYTYSSSDSDDQPVNDVSHSTAKPSKKRRKTNEIRIKTKQDRKEIKSSVKKSSKSNEKKNAPISKNHASVHNKLSTKKDRKFYGKNENCSDSSSSKEFQSKLNLSRIKSKLRAVSQDNTYVETPSKSDDEHIAVDVKQEIELKHQICGEVEKIQKIYEEFKSDLEYQSTYLLKKNIVMLRDSKFIAHKILRMYDSINQEIKSCRDSFAKNYKTWIKNCSTNRSSLSASKDSTSRKKYSVSSSDDSDSSNDVKMIHSKRRIETDKQKTSDHSEIMNESVEKTSKQHLENENTNNKVATADGGFTPNQIKRSRKKIISTKELVNSSDSEPLFEVSKAKIVSDGKPSSSAEKPLHENSQQLVNSSDSEPVSEASKAKIGSDIKSSRIVEKIHKSSPASSTPKKEPGDAANSKIPNKSTKLCLSISKKNKTLPISKKNNIISSKDDTQDSSSKLDILASMEKQSCDNRSSYSKSDESNSSNQESKKDEVTEKVSPKSDVEDTAEKSDLEQDDEVSKSQENETSCIEESNKDVEKEKEIHSENYDGSKLNKSKNVRSISSDSDSEIFVKRSQKNKIILENSVELKEGSNAENQEDNVLVKNSSCTEEIQSKSINKSGKDPTSNELYKKQKNKMKSDSSSDTDVDEKLILKKKKLKKQKNLDSSSDNTIYDKQNKSPKLGDHQRGENEERLEESALLKSKSPSLQKSAKKKKRHSIEFQASDKKPDCDDEILSDLNTSKKSSSIKKFSSKVAMETDINNSQDLFDSTDSEVANTPIRLSSMKCQENSMLLTKSINSSQKLFVEDISKKKQENLENKYQEDIEENIHKETENLIEPVKVRSESSGEDDEEKEKDKKKLLGVRSESSSDDDTEEEAKQKLLFDIESDDERTSIDSKHSTPKKKGLKLKRSLTKRNHNVSSDSSSTLAEQEKNKSKRQLNRRKKSFDPMQNVYYKADQKLRMNCVVVLKRLSKKQLKKYMPAFTASKNYVAKEKLLSLINLDALESKRSKSKSNKTKSNKKSKKQKTVDSMDDFEDFEEFEENEEVGLENNVDCMEVEISNNEAGNEIEDEEAEVSPTDNEEIAKAVLLRDSNSEGDAEEIEDGSNNEENNEVDKEVVKENSKSKPKSKKSKKAKDSENESSTVDDNDKSSWKDDSILKFTIKKNEKGAEITSKFKKKKQSEESEEIELSPIKVSKRKRKPTKKSRVIDSESDVQMISSEEEVGEEDESDFVKESKRQKEKKPAKRKRGKKKTSSDGDTSSSEKRPKGKRKRIKKAASNSESGEDEDSPSKGRKNIRKLLKDKHVADDTKKAAQDEEERLKRIAERQKLFNEMYDARVAGEAKVEKLVLDLDEESKKELVVVHEELVKRLKPHQAQGIKFMWDACYESLKQIEKSEGSGCIIAHCMGLGKTFQVVTLIHTLIAHEETGVNTIMVVCPLSTVLNWVNEFKIWLKHVPNADEIEIYELTKLKKNVERRYMLESWQKTGGVLILGYEMFRNLTSTGKKMRKAMQESIIKSLVDPGADLVICDEGHLLKNEDSAISKAMNLVKTQRRIVLTGTPLQNNLKEYHCMVQFVKPNLLGTKKEFLNRFVNPITNGQFDDSTPYDVKLMKKRAHVLHKMLEGSVQRFDYSVLTPFLPPKQEYVIFVRLSDVQIKMYQHYLDNFARRYGGRNGSLFADFQALQRIWTHPYVLRLNAAKVDKENEKKRFEASDSEGSLKDFIDDEDESDVSSAHNSSESDSNSDVQCIDSDTEKKPTKLTRSARMNAKIDVDDLVPVPTIETTEETAWWSKYVEEEHFNDMRLSTKLMLLFGILKESEQIGDKVLVFSQSLYSLTLIEQFLNLIDQESQNENRELENLDNHSGSWALGLDYFRLDGSTSPENRSAWCKIFNSPKNTRARLFLISTRAGGLGINLTAANRVIIFDASWNPSHDVQSIFRIYRFGQKKPCYIYRFLAAGTMEEKIYNRQVTKLSLACRVVDEQQIERHYSNNDLAELYQFETYEGKSTTLACPKDRLLAEIFLKYGNLVYTYHEHDSLLENKEEEELDEEERKQAWLEYEEEKQGKRTLVNNMNYGNYGINPFMNMNNPNSLNFPEMESIKLLIQKDYPQLPPDQIETVARQAVLDMYRFVDQQSVNQLLNYGGGQNMLSNLLNTGPPQQQYPTYTQHTYNVQNQMMNLPTQMNYPTVNHMPVYSGRGRPPKHLAQMNSPLASMNNMAQLQMQHQQQANIHAMRSNVIRNDPMPVDPLAISPIRNNHDIQITNSPQASTAANNASNSYSVNED